MVILLVKDEANAEKNAFKISYHSYFATYGQIFTTESKIWAIYFYYLLSEFAFRTIKYYDRGLGVRTEVLTRNSTKNEFGE